MNATAAPTMLVNIIGILTLCALALMFVCTIVGAGMAVTGRPGSALRRVGLGIGLPCGSVLAVALLLGLTLVGWRTTALSRVGLDPAPPLRLQPPEAPRAPAATPLEQAVMESLPASNPSPPADAASPLTGHDDRTAPAESTARSPRPRFGGEGQGEGASAPNDSPSPLPFEARGEVSTTPNLPAWTAKTKETLGDVTHLVLSSKQYATVEEARKELAAVAQKLLATDFQQVYATRAYDWSRLSDDVLRQLVVKQEHVETIQRDFGNFFAPMHRVWWQIEFSPAVRSALYPLWKGRVQEQRVVIIGGGLLAATLGLAGLSLVSRRRQTPRPAPPAAAVKGEAVAVGVGAATLLAKRCRKWWK